MAIPRIVVEMTLGSLVTADSAGLFILNTSTLNGTDVLGSDVWVDVTSDLVSISIPPDTTGPLDSPTPQTCTVVLEDFDGAYDPLNTASPYFGQLDLNQKVRITAVDDSTATTYAVWYGYIDEIAPDYGFEPQVVFSCTDALGVLGRVNIGAITPSFDNDPSGTRIGRILDLAQWPASYRAIDTGTVNVQADGFGDTALSLCSRIAQTEIGPFFANNSGIIVFWDRLHIYTATRSQNVQATFSDTGTDIDMPDLVGAVKVTECFNDVHITRNGGTEQIAQDASSMAKRGTLSFTGSVGTMAESDTDALSTASWILARYVNPSMRFPQLNIDALSQPDMLITLLALQEADRIQILRTYGTGSGTPMSRLALISGIGHEITADSWLMSFTLRDAQNFQPFILNTSTLNNTSSLLV